MDATVTLCTNSSRASIFSVTSSINTKLSEFRKVSQRNEHDNYSHSQQSQIGAFNESKAELNSN